MAAKMHKKTQKSAGWIAFGEWNLIHPAGDPRRMKVTRDYQRLPKMEFCSFQVAGRREQSPPEQPRAKSSQMPRAVRGSVRPMAGIHRLATLRASQRLNCANRATGSTLQRLQRLQNGLRDKIQMSKNGHAGRAENRTAPAKQCQRHWRQAAQNRGRRTMCIIICRYTNVQ